MLIRFFACFIIIVCLFSCADTKTTERPTDAIGVGREFIDASLKGKYEDAKKYMLNDTLNQMYFERLQNFYEKMQSSEKEGYKDANIIILGSEAMSDSVMIINYSNTFKNEPSKIKLVRIAKDWWVDFKYSFSGNL